MAAATPTSAPDRGQKPEAPSTEETGDKAGRPLRPGERRMLAVLGLPTFAFALGITVVSTYLPKIAREFTGSTTVIGAIVGTEGLLALFLPILVGTWSDGLRTRLGGRLPFVVGATPVAAVALALMGFVGSLGAMVLAVLVFFAAYFFAYEPYRAMYPDLVEEEIAGRAQSTQAVWRGAATVCALVGGGLLFALGQAVPFLVAAGIAAGAVALFLAIMVRRAGTDTQGERDARPLREELREVIGLPVDHPALRSLLVANALWELSLAALKTFIVLFLTLGLGFSVATSALFIGGGAVFVVAAAAVSGRLGDRLGKARVMRVALWVYSITLLVPFITQFPPVLVPVVPVVCFAGGVVMTLPYALLMPLMPSEEHGALTGFFSMSRGLGTMLGPLIAGVAVDALKGPLGSTQGYAAMWLVCSVATAASIPLLGKVRDNAEDRRRLERA